jgi:hypothetical protein
MTKASLLVAGKRSIPVDERFLPSMLWEGLISEVLELEAAIVLHQSDSDQVC